MFCFRRSQLDVCQSDLLFPASLLRNSESLSPSQPHPNTPYNHLARRKIQTYWHRTDYILLASYVPQGANEVSHSVDDSQLLFVPRGDELCPISDHSYCEAKVCADLEVLAARR